MEAQAFSSEMQVLLQMDSSQIFVSSKSFRTLPDHPSC